MVGALLCEVSLLPPLEQQLEILYCSSVFLSWEETEDRLSLKDVVPSLLWINEAEECCIDALYELLTLLLMFGVFSSTVEKIFVLLLVVSNVHQLFSSLKA